MTCGRLVVFFEYSSINKTDCHNIAELFWKVALYSITVTPSWMCDDLKIIGTATSRARTSTETMNEIWWSAIKVQATYWSYLIYFKSSVYRTSLPLFLFIYWIFIHINYENKQWIKLSSNSCEIAKTIKLI